MAECLRFAAEGKVKVTYKKAVLEDVNSIFEQKEYGEGYMIEKIAPDMLDRDPALKKEFEEKLKDPEFAKKAFARLRFIYERSPYYLEQKIGIYPVGRITGELPTSR